MSRSLVAGSVLVQSISTGIPAYHRHQPEQTTLYSIIAAHYPRFVQKIEHGGIQLQTARVLSQLQRAISTFVIHHSSFSVASGARTGAVTLIQRFGSALNLNVHLHMLFLDGAYTFSGNRPTFHRARRPAGEELNRLLETLSRRIVRVLERRGLLIADPEHPYLDLEPGSSLDHLRAASIHYRIAIGPHAGRKALTLYSVPPIEAGPNSSLLARRAGFSLHAATVCEAHQRSRLERLCRYITRPPTR